MAKLTLTDISSGYLSTSTFNANNTLIETALENTLSRDGTSPNTMGANLDMNSNRVVNLTDGVGNQDAVTVAQLNTAVLGGATSISAIDDVTITSIASGELLKWDGAGWINNTLAEAGISAVGHTHVIANITDFTDNSTNWDTAYGWGDHSGLYASTSHVHEGTTIDATAVTDGYVLTADGAGNAAWEVLPSGGLDGTANESITGFWSYYGDIDIRGVTIEWWDNTFSDSFGIQETGTEASLSSNTNPIKFYANTGAAGGVSLALNTADNSSYRDFYVRNSAAPTTDYVSIQHNGTDGSIACGATGDLNVTGLTGSVKMGSSLKIQEQAAADTQSGGYGQYWVKNTAIVTPMFSDDTGVDHVVGYGNYVLYANSNVTLNYAFMNSAWYSDNATAYTMTLEANTSTAFAVGAQCTIWNEGSGTLTINEGTGTTLYLLDGSAVTDTAGGCTMAQGGYATLIRKSATVYLIMGAGITA